MSYKTGGMFSGNNSGVYLCCFCSSLHITTHMLNLLLIWPCLCGHHKSLPEAFWIAGIKWTAEQVETHEENFIFWASVLHQEHMHIHFPIQLNPGSLFTPMTWQFSMYTASSCNFPQYGCICDKWCLISKRFSLRKFSSLHQNINRTSRLPL